MVFGEIIEPSTRALIIDDEDLENIPNYIEPLHQWEGNIQPPDDIETLIIMESKKALYIASFLIKEKKPVAAIHNEGIAIYEVDKKYIVLFINENKNLILGEIVEILASWIKKAKIIHAITTELINNLQPVELHKNIVTITKCLTNNKSTPFNFCPRLDVPNLIQGLGATVLTYCIHCNLKATLWIVYTDYMPPDSINTSEIVTLLKLLSFDFKVNFKTSSLDHNLYM